MENEEHVYIIRRDSDGLWLLGTWRLGCPALTCVWGDRARDALFYGSQYTAEALAQEIGGCSVIVTRLAKGARRA